MYAIRSYYVDNAKKIMAMNAKGNFPDKLEDFALSKEKKSDFQNAADQFEMNRFDDR